MLFHVRAYLLFFSILIPLWHEGQVVQVPTATDATLRDLSAINNNVVISGYFGYLAKSSDGCASLTTITIPGPLGNATRIQRLDANTIFLLSYSPNGTYLFKSVDGGNNWIPRATSSGAFSHELGFFDTLSALLTDGPYLYKTINGGNSWSNTPCPFQIGTTAIKTYGDSLVCLGGIDVSGTGFMMSKNRGNTWLPAWGTLGHGLEITDFSFMNKDTMFAVSKTTNVPYSETAGFFYTTNGGGSWTDMGLPQLKDAYGVLFKSNKEGYVVGMDSQGFGTVVKTTDLGKNWLTFNTGYKTALMNIALLNDSIGLLSGTEGILLKWNFKRSVFTNIQENTFNEMRINVFPNPAQEKLLVSTAFKLDKMTLINSIGQELFVLDEPQYKQEIDISSLPAGIFFIKAENKQAQAVFKFIKD